MPAMVRPASRLVTAALATLILSGHASADSCKQMYIEGRAMHAELQRKAIDELNAKNYPAACKNMRELARLSMEMRTFAERNCWRNEAYKRMDAAADNIAARTKEICEKAGL
jgi:hypothetical protein